MPLSGLPIELILHIYSDLDPGSQFNLSLSCRRYADLLDKVSAKHRADHEKFYSVSSRQPVSLLKLLHLSIIEPNVFWHLHTLHLVGHGVLRRPSFEPDRMPEYNVFEAVMAEKKVSEADAHRIRQMSIKDLLMYLTRTAYREVWNDVIRAELQQNKPELYELLILALSSRLRHVRFLGFSSAQRLRYPDAHVDTLQWRDWSSREYEPYFRAVPGLL